MLVQHVAEVKVAPALRHGVITRDGEGEAVTGHRDDAPRRRTAATWCTRVGRRVEEIQRELPPGVTIDVIYDRADFVGRTLTTVLKNLVEGVLIVTVVLALFLGTIRGALAVVLGIPASMSIALFGMHLFGVTGDLMCLGRHRLRLPRRRSDRDPRGGHRRDRGPEARGRAPAPRLRQSRRRVVGAPGRVRGRDHHARLRPAAHARGHRGQDVPADGADHGVRALRRARLLGALLPGAPGRVGAAAPRATGRGGSTRSARLYARIVPCAIARGARCSSALRRGAGGRRAGAFGRAGAEFVPRIFEGDAVVTIRRAPSISLGQGARARSRPPRRSSTSFPEVVTTLGMTGRAEVAIDPSATTTPTSWCAWRRSRSGRRAHDFDELSEKPSRTPSRAGSRARSSRSRSRSRTRPTSSSAARAPTCRSRSSATRLDELSRIANEMRETVRGIRARRRARRAHPRPADDQRGGRSRAHGALRRPGRGRVRRAQATREGVKVGTIYEGHRRFDLRLLQPPATATAEGLGDLLVETLNGESVPLRDVVKLTEDDGPTAVRRVQRRRAVRVDVNLRGRDLLPGSTRRGVGRPSQGPAADRLPDRVGRPVRELRARAEAAARRHPRRDRDHLRHAALDVPERAAGARRVSDRCRSRSPAACSVCSLRGLPFTLSAAVGFIALGGIAVLNGVVIGQEVQRRLARGAPPDDAVAEGSVAVVRAVLTTTAVAALGFLPMAVSTGAGSEVQRPLATAVAVGITVGALTTLLVLPGVLVTLLRRRVAA